MFLRCFRNLPMGLGNINFDDSNSVKVSFYVLLKIIFFVGRKLPTAPYSDGTELPTSLYCRQCRVANMLGGVGSYDLTQKAKTILPGLVSGGEKDLCAGDCVIYSDHI